MFSRMELSGGAGLGPSRVDKASGAPGRGSDQHCSARREVCLSPASSPPQPGTGLTRQLSQGGRCHSSADPESVSGSRSPTAKRLISGAQGLPLEDTTHTEITASREGTATSQLQQRPSPVVANAQGHGKCRVGGGCVAGTRDRTKPSAAPGCVGGPGRDRGHWASLHDPATAYVKG